MDISELYDYEIMKVGKITKELASEFSKKTNTQMNLAEMAKKAEDRFQAIGLKVHVDLAPVLFYQPPCIEIMGRIDTTEKAKEEFDHDRKRWEVLGGNSRGEKFRGEKETYKG
jgi:hypothetical protein